MSGDEATRTVASMAAAREAMPVREMMTIAAALGQALWLRKQPEQLLDDKTAKQVIDALLAGIESSPCFMKGLMQGIPTFTLLAYDKAGHVAMRAWCATAEQHGCRHEKVDEARGKVSEWEKLPDARWPT